MLLPGVGFDVVPSDCLAAQLKRRLPDAIDLKIYIGVTNPGASRGTSKTAMQGIAAGTRVRRGGRLVALDRAARDACDFGDGVRPTVQISWGDVSTAFYSTGIPNIEVQIEFVPALKVIEGLPGFVKSFLGLAPMQSLLGLLDRPSARRPERRGAAIRTLHAGGRGAERERRDRSNAPDNPGRLYADRHDRARYCQARCRGRIPAGVSDPKSDLRSRLYPWFRWRDAGGPERVNAGF